MSTHATPAGSITARRHPLMAALGHGLPITLLVDLIDPNGPRSLEMLRREGITPDADQTAPARETRARSA